MKKKKKRENVNLSFNIKALNEEKPFCVVWKLKRRKERTYYIFLTLDLVSSFHLEKSDFFSFKKNYDGERWVGITLCLTGNEEEEVPLSLFLSL